ncbi:hypothetical protein [Winogradskyella jejuensis]|uniref:Uncharacterized protein n=1 Tax=Winogradskyella jejuensis TaxID=1089305 RepID=A0A1M5UAW9_9FLAO|nr:hypothetical protein [Winogradskyella jejuensis]SHH60185.1 hypothetical protein SAMN05444148_2423 [Winogradskyella jejuensis]
MLILRRLLAYCIWILIAFALAFLAMHMLLDDESTLIGHGVLKKIVILHIVPITGSIIAFLYIFFDILYLRKTLKNQKNAIYVRFLAIVTICVLVTAIHYVLEKGIDII